MGGVTDAHMLVAVGIWAIVLPEYDPHDGCKMLLTMDAERSLYVYTFWVYLMRDLRMTEGLHEQCDQQAGSRI